MSNPLYHQLLRRLAPAFPDPRECRQVAGLVLEDVLGCSGATLYIREDSEISLSERERLAEITERLLQDEPVQYVLGKTVFCGHTFRTGPGALIPRPETEDLVQTALETARRLKATSPEKSLLLIDAGTGSGCIAHTMALALPEARTEAFDYSSQALAVAQENKVLLKSSARLHLLDMLRLSAPDVPLPDFLIPQPHETALWISNPPYIHPQEAQTMERRVLAYEPAQALFAPEDEPTFFYKAIAQGASRSGARAVCCEINPLYADPIAQIFRTIGYSDTRITPDRYGKARILTATT